MGEISKNLFSFQTSGNIILSKENGDISKGALVQGSISQAGGRGGIKQQATARFHTPQATLTMGYVGNTDPDSFVCVSPFY